jgi:hypothetical protein
MPLVTTRSFARSRNTYAQLRTSEACVPHRVPLKSQTTLGSVSLHHTRALLSIRCSRAAWRAHDARDRPTMYALHASLLDHRGSARAGLTSCCDRCAASLSDPCACSLWQALHGSPMGCSTSHYRRPSHLASHHRHSHHCPRHLHLRLHSSHAWSPHGPHSLPPHLAPLRLSAQTTASPHLSASLHSASSSHATASYYTAALRHEAVP